MFNSDFLKFKIKKLIKQFIAAVKKASPIKPPIAANPKNGEEPKILPAVIRKVGKKLYLASKKSQNTQRKGKAINRQATSDWVEAMVGFIFRIKRRSRKNDNGKPRKTKIDNMKTRGSKMK